MTCVTPSPESMTVPVNVRSVTRLEDQEAARARTACTAMYKPLMLKDSKKISAICSRFSGGFKGGSVYLIGEYATHCRTAQSYQQEVMILRLCPQILEDSLLPIPLHVVPIVYHAMADWIVHAISGCSLVCDRFIANEEVKVLHTTLRC